MPNPSIVTNLAQHQLGKNATGAPHINVRCVVGGSKDQLRCPEDILMMYICTETVSKRPVVSRADIGDVGFASHQMLGASKVAQLEDSRLGIKQKILDGTIENSECRDQGLPEA